MTQTEQQNEKTYTEEYPTNCVNTNLLEINNNVTKKEQLAHSNNRSKREQTKATNPKLTSNGIGDSLNLKATNAKANLATRNRKEEDKWKYEKRIGKSDNDLNDGTILETEEEGGSEKTPPTFSSSSARE